MLPRRIGDAGNVDGVAAGTLLAESLVRQGLRPATHGELAPPPPKTYTGALAAFGRTAT